MAAPSIIKEFQGEFRWLSNFAPVTIASGVIGEPFQSVEAAYQAAKNDNLDWHKFCRKNTAMVIKKASRSIVIRPDWPEIKQLTMLGLLMHKYQVLPYREQLIATGNAYIQEGNRWGDTFWGVDLRTGRGDNRLGKMIMSIRDKLQGKGF